ncbi:MAG: peptidylprolyl isomerase [Acidisphaera sp.]|nr:peptidylprolyl isomerase [Acidisphaera sp.]
MPMPSRRVPTVISIAIWGLIPALLAAAVGSAQAQPTHLAARPAVFGRGPASPPAAIPDATAIVAVVNGDVISRGDVDNRRRLFAISTGMPVTPEILNRLTPQVTRQLIDERLRLQEVQKRKIVVADEEIAHAITEIESRNNMPPGTLRHRLEADGVGFRTLIDQLRVQIGWTRVLREQLGNQVHVTDAEIAARQEQIKAQLGQPEFRVGEIFIPVDEPSHEAEARNFADTVIQQLRAGAPFAVVAAQFSQSQTALEGGDLGWVESNQLDPEVAKVVTEMPVGAISNPIRVAGGFSIVQLRAKRQVGNDLATMVKLREAFLPFSTPLNPSAPTDQQKQALDRARQISASVHSCEQMEAANRAAGNARPADPGDIRLENVSPPSFRALLASLPDGRASPPLVAGDGIAVVIVCGREQRNIGMPAKEQIADQIVNERAELASRQLQRDLRRRATIEMRSGGA